MMLFLYNKLKRVCLFAGSSTPMKLVVMFHQYLRTIIENVCLFYVTRNSKEQLCCMNDVGFKRLM